MKIASIFLFVFSFLGYSQGNAGYIVYESIVDGSIGTEHHLFIQ
ncbi:hypothetical protein AB4865_08490 [Capnocytophaga sp. ARDL2]